MKKKGNPNKRSKKYKTKAQSQEKHAKQRAFERYGLNLSTSDLNGIKNQIQCGNAQHIEAQSNRVSVFTLNMAGTDVPIVYDTQRHTVVSFLPTEYLVTGNPKRS